MRQFTVNLREEVTEHGFMPTLTVCLLEGNTPRPTVIIAPGGGYTKISEDCEKTAMQYAAAGFHTAILNYCTIPHHFPDPQYDLAAAVKILRERSAEWKTCPDKITICGFSAGAHLCASVAVLWNNTDIFPIEDIKSEIHKPNACILYSAVLTTKLEHCKAFVCEHVGINSLSNLKYAACDLQVNEATPPVFMFGTYEDKLTNPENMLFFAEKLVLHKVPFELHIFPKGKHCAPWCDEIIWAKSTGKRDCKPIKLSVDWLMELYDI